MNYAAVEKHIVEWLLAYAKNSGSRGFVVGISGGIDSAVTSTLCAKTGLETLVISMPIRQHHEELSRGEEHMAWLQANHSHVRIDTVDLTQIFESIENTLPKTAQTFLSMANTRSRLRMTTLYAFAGAQNLLVAGTGNKIEDFGIGFFTKYGDGGVDLSPIADLVKSQVYKLGAHMGVPQSILHARPTDGLFADCRTDEDQIGASYDELEWAMEHAERGTNGELNEREKKVMEIYMYRHKANRHKMDPIPVCLIPEALKAK